MTFFTSLTKKLIAISLILLLFLSVFIYSIFSFTSHMRSEALRLNMGSQLMHLFSEMAWHAQRIVEREFEILDPVQRESHIAELKNRISAFDHVVRELKEGSKEKGLSPMEYAEALPMLNTVIEKWNNHQKPVLMNLIELPVDVPEKKARELLHMYDAGAHEYVHEVDRLLIFLEKDYRTEIKEFDRFMPYILGFFSIAAIIGGAYVRYFFIKPITSLRDATKELEKGNFDVTIDVKTSDELGELSKAFNAMTVRLTEVISVTEKRAEDILALNIASNNIIGIMNTDMLYKTICESLLKIYDLKLVWLGLVEEGSFSVKPVAQAGDRDEYLSNLTVTWDDSPTGNGPTGMAIKKRFSQMVPLVDTEPSYAPWIEEARKHGFKSVMAAPLICCGNMVIGALNLYSHKPGYFTQEMVEMVQIFANQSSTAVDNARMLERLEKAVEERTRELEDAKLIAESANEAKSNFLASMSHELRSPLNVIIGFSEALVSGVYGEIKGEHAEYINYIFKGGIRLLSLIDSIMELTKAGTGDMTLYYAECSPNNIISDAVGMFSEKVKKHRINLHVDIGEGLLTCCIDESKIKYVIVNLLSNALKNTGDGGSVSVQARKVIRDPGSGVSKKGPIPSPQALTPDSDFIEIAVSDTGPVMTEEQRANLFKPFHQTEVYLAVPGASLRIGLELCKRFVELHGGSIWVECLLAEGAETTEHSRECAKETGNRFIFVLPRKPSGDKLTDNCKNKDVLDRRQSQA